MPDDGWVRCKLTGKLIPPHQKKLTPEERQAERARINAKMAAARRAKPMGEDALRAMIDAAVEARNASNPNREVPQGPPPEDSLRWAFRPKSRRDRL